jgi:5-methylcytosine-specific restriction endonuclease McrA
MFCVCGTKLTTRNKPGSDGVVRCRKCAHKRRNEKYLSCPEKKAKREEYLKEYSKTPAFKATQKRYLASEKGKDKQRRYHRSEKGRETRNRIHRERYWSHPEYERMKALARVHGTTIELLSSLPKVCAMCETTENPTVDHMHPVSKGGLTVAENIQTLCNSCNAFKNNRLVLAGNQGVLING